MEDELKHARNYMNIQKIRYKNKFTVEFQEEDAILSCCTAVSYPPLDVYKRQDQTRTDGDGNLEKPQQERQKHRGDKL